MNITCLIPSDEGMVFITPERTSVINDEVILKNYFDNLSKKRIKRMTRTSDKYYSSITFDDNTRVKFQNFNDIRKKAFCRALNKQISIFKLKQIANKLSGKKLIVIGSVVGIATVSITNLDTSADKESNSQDFSTTASVEEFLKPVHLELHDIDDNDIVEAMVHTDNNDNYDYNDDNDELDVDPLSLIDSEQLENESNDIFNDNYNVELAEQPLAKNNLSFNNNENILNDGLDYTKIETLRDIDSYDQFILLASNLYGVDYDKAISIVKEKWDTFTTPGKIVNDSYAQEIDRMKDLVNRGFINGDLNVIGIFLTIKDYAIDYLNLSKEPAIYSDKTQEEREKDIINIAKYIYGIDDSYLLSMLIATTRVESANFTSPATINKNNIGGNMSTVGTFEHPVLNTYKTAEIGEESFVRNFLNCYGKSLVAHNYDRSLPIPYVMKDKFCPHTPNEWESVITEKTAAIQESSLIDEYLDNSSKSI